MALGAANFRLGAPFVALLAVACGAAPVAPAQVVGQPSAKVAAAAPAAPIAPIVLRPSADLGEIAVVTSPVLYTYAPEPDLAATVKPLLSREAQRKWAALETALRDSRDPLLARLNGSPMADAIASVREPICGDEASVKAMPPDPIVTVPSDAAAADPVGAATTNGGTRAIDRRNDLVKELEREVAITSDRASDRASDRSGASLVALGYIVELGPPGPPDDDPARIARAASLYDRAKAKAALDTPIGFLARLRLAGISTEDDAAAEYDALLGANLANAFVRPWLRWLAARPLPNYTRAAGVFRAIALSAEAPLDKLGARVEWMIATYDEGNWRAALDLAIVLMRTTSSAVPHAAYDIAARAIDRLGGIEQVPSVLPKGPRAALMDHMAALAKRDSADLHARAAALSARCLATTNDAGDPGENGIRVDVVARVYSDRHAEIQVTPSRPAARFAPALACLDRNGARYFADAESGAHVVYAVSR